MKPPNPDAYEKFKAEAVTSLRSYVRARIEEKAIILGVSPERMIDIMLHDAIIGEDVAHYRAERLKDNPNFDAETAEAAAALGWTDEDHAA